MEKRSVVAMIVIAMCAVMFWVVTSFSQEDVTNVADSVFEEPMRPAVPFSHDEHNEKAEIEDCDVCHHQYEDGELVEGESSEGTECSECHASENESFPMALVRVYHLQCKRCHLERRSGPVMCAECHPRR
jgi:hypothetical protein